MDSGLIAAIAVIAINILGWAYTFGNMNGRVNSLEKTTQRHEKILNDGVVQELSELKSQVSNLEGTVKTYIDLTKR